MTYRPSPKIIDKYADLLVNCALAKGKGIAPGEVVWVRAPECAKPLFSAVRDAVWKAGGHVISSFSPEGISRSFYEIATEEQLQFFPKKYFDGLAEQVDHMVAIIGTTDKFALKGIDGKLLSMPRAAQRPFKDRLDEKESRGEFSWTLAMYGTQAMAAEVGMPLREYWREIIDACWLREKDPKQKWRWIFGELDSLTRRLDDLELESVHVDAPDTDLTVKLGPGRKWLGGGGANIPSYEVFISPDWRGTQGRIRFTEPLYRFGNLIKDVYLEFDNGRIVTATAGEGQDLLQKVIAQENADKIGEFSLTDRRFSGITRFMGETLFDENVGGENGNTHLAIGNAYKDSYTGDPSSLSKEDWARLGYNESSVHTDIVATSPRTVIGTLKDGSQKIIYADGEFQI